MTIVLWGRRRLIALLLYWARSAATGTRLPQRGCAVFCPLGGTANCPDEDACPMAYRRHWSWGGRLLGATVLVYDANPTRAETPGRPQSQADERARGLGRSVPWSEAKGS